MMQRIYNRLTEVVSSEHDTFVVLDTDDTRTGDERLAIVSDRCTCAIHQHSRGVGDRSSMSDWRLSSEGSGEVAVLVEAVVWTCSC